MSIYITRDGTALALGSAAGPSGSLAHERVLLVAQSEGTDAACSDTDGDGVAGLSRLELLLRDTVQGDPYVALVEPARGADLHLKGRYAASIRLLDPDGTEIPLEGMLRLPRDLAVPRPGR